MFVEEGGWSAPALRELATFVVERVGATECVPYTVISGVGLVSQVEKLGRTIAGNSLKNYILLERDDFAYNKSATKAFPEGYIARYLDDARAAVPNSIFTCFRADDQKIVPAYLDYLFASNLHGKWLRNFITIGARAHGSLNVNDADLMALPVPLPEGSTSLNEQQKIADCLSSLDELIAAQGRKVEALKTFKRGLMQQLFPCEGETLPRLRFPEFRDAPEWESPTIQDLIDRKSIVGHLDGNHGELYPRADEFSTKGIPYISANDFRTGRVDFNTCRRLPLERAVNFKKGVAKDGDVLFAHNATVGPVAKLATAHDFVILSTTATYFRCDQSQLSSDFLMFGLTSPSFVAQYTRVMSQSTRDQIPITAQRKFFLQIPKLAEQHRIASCLAAFDGQVAAESDKLDSLRSHKKGLMQQLFPSLEEAT